MFGELTFFGALLKGGVTTFALILLSIVSVALMLERTWRIRRFAADLAETYDMLVHAIDQAGAQSAASLCAGRGTALTHVFRAGYDKRSGGRDEVLRAMELAARKEISLMENYLGLLGTIGATAPFVGLFGTVLGIIDAFSRLSASEGAGPAVVADGIAQALVATAAGLFVAVPAVMAYNFLVRAIRKRALDLEAKAVALADRLPGGA